MAPRGPQRAQGGLQDGSSYLRIAQGSIHEASPRPQDGFKCHPSRRLTPPSRTFTVVLPSCIFASDGLLRPDDGPQTAPESLQRGPRGPQEGPESAQERPKSGPRGPQDAICEPPRGWPQEASQTPPGSRAQRARARGRTRTRTTTNNSNEQQTPENIPNSSLQRAHRHRTLAPPTLRRATAPARTATSEAR
eukprot:9500092-Pyramimonas_sp.AAC.1